MKVKKRQTRFDGGSAGGVGCVLSDPDNEDSAGGVCGTLSDPDNEDSAGGVGCTLSGPDNGDSAGGVCCALSDPDDDFPQRYRYQKFLKTQCPIHIFWNTLKTSDVV